MYNLYKCILTVKRTFALEMGASDLQQRGVLALNPEGRNRQETDGGNDAHSPEFHSQRHDGYGSTSLAKVHCNFVVA